MKMTFKNMAVVALLSCLAIAIFVVPDAAQAAPLWDVSGWIQSPGEVIQANLVLLGLQRNLKSLKQQAKDKEAEITDDLDDDQVRSIETEHADILRQIEEKETEISDFNASAENDADADERSSDLTAAQAADVMSIGRRAGMDVVAVEKAIRSNISVELFRTLAFDHMADAASRNEVQPNRQNIQIRQDEQETRRNALTEAMSYRLGVPIPEAGPSDAAREFMELRAISSFAATAIGYTGRVDSTRAMDDLYERAGHTTSDFPIIFEGSVNRILEQRYALAVPTYRRIARRADFRDFRPHTTVKLGDFPLLKKVAEDGEIKYGTFAEGKEITEAFAYARALSITRTMLINDDLGAIGVLLGSYGETIALFEEIAFYASALNGKLADNKPVFHAGHNNLAGAGSGITLSSVSDGRKSMSKQKSTDDNPLLSNAAHILLCGPDTITDAEMLLTTITPATVSNVNIFSGRLEAVESLQIEGGEWYLMPDAASGQATNYRWGMLQGYEAPRVRMDEPFGRQGMAMSVEHDFGVGATDSRHGYKNPGA